MTVLSSDSLKIAQNSRDASLILRTFTHAQRNFFLKDLASELHKQQDVILSDNKKDLNQAQKNKLSSAMIDRLSLTPERLKNIIQSVRKIKQLPNPLNKTLETKKSPEGLKIKRTSTPIGSILFIFESRPNVTIDGASLCIKSGNSVILKGGKECLYTNQAFYKCIQASLTKNKFPLNAVQLITNINHNFIKNLLQNDKNIDLVIPRGGEGLIQSVVKNSKIPVIKHYKGLCHIFVDASANIEKSSHILLNAKVQRPGVCNAMETLLLHEKLGVTKIKQLLKPLFNASVCIIGCSATRKIFNTIKSAKSIDWDTEYLNLDLSVKIVKNLDAAIFHIQKHGTNHTEAILSEDKQSQKEFISRIDSSSVMINASTRFADGSVYGLGAEVGISTDRLHARGPMGIESLTTYQWIITGSGHIRQ